MKRVLKWVGVVLGAVIVGLLGWIYGASEFELRRRWDVAAEPIAVAADSAMLVAGERIARTRGCTGCHAEQLAGKVFFDEPGIARIVAPNLTRVAAAASDAELARAIRHGIRADGRALVGMPSDMFFHLSDADVGAVIAYIRSLPLIDDTLPRRQVRFLGRLGLVLGEYQMTPRLIDHSLPRLGDSPAAIGERRGEYLARTSCPECHGADFEGGSVSEQGRTPPLAGMVGYSEEEFVALVRGGKAKGGRTLGLMATVATGRLRHYSDEDLREIHRFLSSYRPVAP